MDVTALESSSLAGLAMESVPASDRNEPMESRKEPKAVTTEITQMETDEMELEQ